VTAELSKARRTLLQRYLRGGAAREKTRPDTIPKRKGSGPAPLSYSQQQIWLHSQLAGEALIYNEPITIRFHGALDSAVLERSFMEIVRRHEAWRTTFEWNGDEGVQIVQTAPERIEIPFVDLCSLPQLEREGEAIRLATKDARQPFDLARGPMYRLRLVRMSDAEHRLFITLHHIIIDGISLYRILLPELQTLYDAFLKNESPRLESLPIQYPDYAVWQRDSFKELTPDQHSYWKTVCAGLPVLDLQTDRPRPSVQTYAGAMEQIEISPATTAALKALSEEQGATPFMTMVATLMALLHGYTGQEDMVIGGVSSGRHHTETMGLLGCFLNTVPIRCAFSKDLSFTDLLARVRNATLGALSHDEVPFELLVQKFSTGRDPSRTPLLQVLIAVEPPLDPLKDGWGFTYLDVDTGTSKFDLELGLDDRPEGLFGRFIYNTDLFEKETIVILKSRWLQLLDRITADPTQRLAHLSSSFSPGRPEARPSGETCLRMSGEKTEQQPLNEWNAKQTNYPRESTIQRVFEEQVHRTPSATAVIFGKTHLSYDELNRRANRLAHRLRKLGVTRDLPVGVCLERSLDMVVSLLAVLKAGGAYVPLDPAYPAERLALMIEDTAMPVILTHTHVKDRCGRGGATVAGSVRGAFAANDRNFLCIDSENFDDEDDRNPPDQSRAEDLAYIMYTSGSTGTPKGVAIPHRGVVRLVKGTNYASFSPDEIFLQLAPISFDASTFEIWGALLNGGKLVVMPPAPPSLEDIGTAIRRHGVTTLWLTAGLFNAMVDERLPDLRPLRQLLAGGDVLSIPHVRKALGELKGTRLINGYGPTESTTFACCHTISPDTPLDDAIPIGQPIANTTAYVLDTDLRPVPIGTSGELCLGGDGLARGYWRSEELTSRKFIADPFSDRPGARLYRTGDLARWRHDGVIEFLGRTDNQIKLRGFRIEPGEIEAALKQQSGVLDAAALAREDTPNDKRLVGYVVLEASGSATFDQSALMAALKKSLPDYMVPSAIVALPALPRTPNGKLDRNALPSPNLPATKSAGDVATLKTSFEKKLAALWARVLGLERVGVTDNFFDLGGHSLSGLRLVNQVGEMLGEHVPLAILFEAPTVTGMATLLEKNHGATRNLPVPVEAHPFAPIVPIDRESRRARRKS